MKNTLKPLAFFAVAVLGLLIASQIQIRKDNAALSSFFDQIQLVVSTTGGASSSSLVQPATAAVETVKSSAGQIYGIQCFNILSTPVWIHSYNVASGSITLGTTADTERWMCPGNTAGAGFVIEFTTGDIYSTAINYITSLNVGTTDHTAITANSVSVNFLFK